jgi:GT2 family glycosyltransferase
MHGRGDHSILVPHLVAAAVVSAKGAGQRAVQVATAAASIAAGALAIHAAVNQRHLRRPVPATSSEHISVLIPARNEAGRIGATLASVLAQVGVPNMQVIVLDDGSTDDTAQIVQSFADPRLTLIHGEADPPPGWLGKPWACARLAEHASGSVLIFIDADVVLEPWAIGAAVLLLRTSGLALISPYPRQIAHTWPERLVQPLLVWSWLSTLPLRQAENSSRPSLAAANGQCMVFDAAAYQQIGGHAAVRDNVLEDVGLMRAIKSAGLRGNVVDGFRMAQCRMYSSTADMVDGYTKSLWAAFGGPWGSLGVAALLGGTYLMPPMAAVLSKDSRTRAIGLAGYGAGVAGRMIVASRTGERTFPDALAHPASIAALLALNALSWSRHQRGRNRWKGRQL